MCKHLPPVQILFLNTRAKKQLVRTIITLIIISTNSNLNGKSDGCTALSLAVSFDDQTTKCASRECENVSRQRCGTNDHQPHPPSRWLLDLAEDQFIPYAVVPDYPLLDFRFLRPHPQAEYQLFQAWVLKFSLDLQNADWWLCTLYLKRLIERTSLVVAVFSLATNGWTNYDRTLFI